VDDALMSEDWHEWSLCKQFWVLSGRDSTDTYVSTEREEQQEGVGAERLG
jgi:hypothetical protein